MVAEGSLFRKKGTAVNAGCSRVQCLFKSSSSSLCLGKEQPLHTVAHWGMLPGADTNTGRPLLTWGQEVPWNSAMTWDQSSGQPMTASVVKQCPKSMSIWWQKGEEQRDPCLQIKQAASLTALIGSDPFLRWTLDLHGITQIAETAGIKKQTEGLFFQHLYNELGQDFILQGRTESAQFENLLPVTLSHKGLAGEQWVRCDVLGSSVKASAV